MNEARRIIEAVQKRDFVGTKDQAYVITEDELSAIEMLLNQIKGIVYDKYIYKSDMAKVAGIKAYLEDY